MTHTSDTKTYSRVNNAGMGIINQPSCREWINFQPFKATCAMHTSTPLFWVYRNNTPSLELCFKAFHLFLLGAAGCSWKILCSLGLWYHETEIRKGLKRYMGTSAKHSQYLYKCNPLCYRNNPIMLLGVASSYTSRACMLCTRPSSNACATCAIWFDRPTAPWFVDVCRSWR